MVRFRPLFPTSMIRNCLVNGVLVNGADVPVAVRLLPRAALASCTLTQGIIALPQNISINQVYSQKGSRVRRVRVLLNVRTGLACRLFTFSWISQGVFCLLRWT